MCVRGSKPRAGEGRGRAGQAPRQRVAGEPRPLRAAPPRAALFGLCRAGGRLSPRPGSPGAPALGRQPPTRSVRGPSPFSGVGRAWGSRGGGARLPGLPPTGTRSARRARAAAPAVTAPAAAAAEGCGLGVPGAGGGRAPRASLASEGGTPRPAAERPTPGEHPGPGCRGAWPSSGAAPGKQFETGCFQLKRCLSCSFILTLQRGEGKFKNLPSHRLQPSRVY